MLKANCRAQFTADDFQFVVKCLSRSRQDAVALADLLSDETTRDCVLDHDLIYEAVVQDAGCLKVSTAFYFYVLIRRVLMQGGIDDRYLSDYIAAAMVEFGKQAAAANTGSPNAALFAYPYISDLLEMLTKAGPWERLMIRTHVGDYALIICGIFADRVRAQSQRRGGPSLRFYEEVGQSCFQAAAKDRLADETEHKLVFRGLGDNFQRIRLALNHLSENILHLTHGEMLPPPSMA